MQNVNAIFVC